MDCICNLKIPKSGEHTYIIRPSTKTWINGIPLGYEDYYDASLLKNYLTEKEFSSIMEQINDSIYEYAPCSYCFWYGYVCCFCTLGLSFVVPFLCMKDVTFNLRKTVTHINEHFLLRRQM